MSRINTCNTCNRTVLRHSYHMKCHNCKCLVHLNCLPRVKRSDTIYTERDENDWFCTKCLEQTFPFNHIFREDEYLQTLSENWSSEKPWPIPFELLDNQDRLFSPFELNEHKSHPLIDCDPDIQFYNNQFNPILRSCDYFLEDSFNELFGGIYN